MYLPKMMKKYFKTKNMKINKNRIRFDLSIIRVNNTEDFFNLRLFPIDIGYGFTRSLVFIWITKDSISISLFYTIKSFNFKRN